ncbi:FAD-binding protein [Streptomyces sp. NPDC051105]|uniref:FAD-binding protein n=1 Tax=Streptomyces sp. NPDC051105 TaxID=3154843 RepID=UPI003421F470
MSSLGQQLTTSVLVVGSGASDLRAAIEVAEAGVAVVLVTQRAREDAPAGAAWDDPEWAPAAARLGDTGSGTRLTRRGRAAYRPGAAPALPGATVWSATTGVRRTPLWPDPTGTTEPWRDASDDAGPAA